MDKLDNGREYLACAEDTINTTWPDIHTATTDDYVRATYLAVVAQTRATIGIGRILDHIADRLDKAQPATTHGACSDTHPSQICGAPNPDQPGMICGDVPNHYGVHDHLRTWWPAGHYPPGAEPCDVPHGSDTCRLYDGHPGPCNTTNDHRRS